MLIKYIKILKTAIYTDVMRAIFDAIKCNKLGP